VGIIYNTGGISMIMAVESEFGIADGNSLGRASAIQDEVVKSMPFIPARGRGVYLANGARAYIDAGCQNEYCTPETSDPEELVIHELAGRRLMADAAENAGQALLCSNVDPVSQTTWGSHENYSSRHLITKPSMVLPLLNHLGTRKIYAGAGGLSLIHSGATVLMSPKIEFIRAGRGTQGVNRRTMVFNKPANHGRLCRNHIICGESLLSHYANYLKYATTALVIACLDAGLPLPDIRFRMPLFKVIHQINRDLRMQRLYELHDGRRFRALDVQESLLESMEGHFQRLPPWAAKAVYHWREVLDDLRDEREVLKTRIDWMLYRHLLFHLCGELGLDAGALLEGHTLAARSEVAQLKAYANELYVRLHILGRDSLFDQLDHESRLSHAVSGVTGDAVAAAMIHAPEGRARERSVLIHKYWKQDGLKMSWSVLEDFREEASTKPIVPNGGTVEIIRSTSTAQRQRNQGILNQAAGCFREGNYSKTLELYRGLSRIDGLDAACDCIQNVCLSHARLGNKHKALRMLKLDASLSPPYIHYVYRLFCAVNFGLQAPAYTVGNLLQKCDQLLGSHSRSLEEIDYLRLIQEQCRAQYLNSTGRPGAAEELCRRLLADRHHWPRTRMTARTRSFLASALLAQGKLGKAANQIRLAMQSQVEEGLFGDLAIYAYPLTARLTGSTAKAQEILRKAELTLRKQGNPLALARVLCLKARRLSTSENLPEVRRLRRECSAVKGCRLADRIINNWEEWIAGSAESRPDDYWGIL
jgi:proteasome accessory factor A